MKLNTFYFDFSVYTGNQHTQYTIVIIGKVTLNYTIVCKNTKYFVINWRSWDLLV